jgi:hypothetical protein
MAWALFTRDYIFTPDEDRRSAVKYLGGRRYIVRKQCLDKAVGAGAAAEVEPPAAKPAAAPRRRRRGGQAPGVKPAATSE